MGLLVANQHGGSVAGNLVLTFIRALAIFRSALTKPSFANLIVLATGWVLDPGAVTQALVVTQMAGATDYEKYHRFFSRGTWNPDDLGRRLFDWIMSTLPSDEPIRLAVDDTVAPKKGEHVFGVDAHIDAVRSTKKYKVFCLGHCWVVLAVLVKVPFSKHVWALPILFRLYRNKKTCANKKLPYRKKTELAREMVDLVVGWAKGRAVEVTGDSAYCNSTVIHGLPDSVHFIGDMRPDAVLTALPPQKTTRRGRPRKRGRRLASPEKLAKDSRRPWQTCEVKLNGKPKTVQYKECWAQWYRACGTRLLHIVVVRVETGSIGLRTFFATDRHLTVEQILEGYSGRWAIEVSFRNLKQLLGFADSSARKPEAVKRVAPFVGMTYTLLILWFTEHVYQTPYATPPFRPWYPHKSGLSFEDILRAARRVLNPQRFLDLPTLLDNLHNSNIDLEPPATPRQEAA
ncbi:MAG: hypothetical protein D6689_09930 [Deltaproteobacteria bacterium]|nr:MAG: hypothetical protein D6689_09930 [Deltaproteobacteria bacterium]